MSWQQAAMLIVADVVGTGVLALPGALRSLGWVGGLAVLFGCYPLNLYTGLLLERLRRFAPGAVTLGDLALATLGRGGGVFGWVLLYIYLQLLLGDYLLVMQTSLLAMVDSHGFDRVWAFGITVALLMCTNQLRTLQNCTALCVLSAATMAGALGLCLSAVVTDGCPARSEAHEATDFWGVFGAISTFALAFAGQSIFLEVMAEMREPKEFQWALNIALPGLLVVYAAAGCGTLLACGEDTPPYLLDAVAPGSVSRRVVGALLFSHTLVSYTINQQVLARGMHLILDPARADALTWGQPGALASSFEWFAITTGHLLLALFLAAGVKAFEDIVQLIGALMCTPLCLVLPLACLVFAPRAAVLQLKRSWSETAVAALLLLASAAFAVIGTAAALRKIARSKE